MATIAAAQVSVVSVDGTTERIVTAKLLGVTAGDILDVGNGAGILPAGYQFRKVRTAQQNIPTSSATSGAMTVAGTQLTVAAGPSNDDGWVVVTGEGY